MFDESTQSAKGAAEGTLLALLRCPFCGGSFELSQASFAGSRIEYGILTCHCGRYPIVAAIPVLKKGGIVDDVLRLIEAEQHRSALLAMLLPESPSLAPAWIKRLPASRALRRLKQLAHQQKTEQWRKRAATLLHDAQGRVTACEIFDFYFQQRRKAYEYFAYRPSQPRHLVALSFISIIPQAQKPILDVACGCGHLTHGLLQRARGRQVIALDDWFFGVYVGKHWLAPEAEFVCCAADSSLPFSDGAFSTVFCSDAFHYFANKLIPIREFKRLTLDSGLILLVWVHNALWRCQHDGLPLRPEGYRELVADMPHRLVGDRDVLARYLDKNGPALAKSAAAQELAQQPLISIVASHRGDVFRDYGAFDDWPHAQGRLGLNPLYVMDREHQNGLLRLQRRFPSAHYEQEHQESKNYLPAEVRLPADVIDDLKQGRRSAAVAELLDHRVVVGMPERYRVSDLA